LKLRALSQATVAVVAASLAILPGAPALATPINVITRVAGHADGSFGGETPGPALNSGLFAPFQLARDAGGNLYVADFGNKKFAKISSGTTLSTIAGSGSFNTMVPGVATSSPFMEPRGIAVDSAGNVFIGDTLDAHVGKIATNGQLSYFAGNGGSGTPAAGAATSQPVVPIALAIDASDNLYITNQTPRLILKVTPGGALSVFAGTGSAGANTPGTATSSDMSPYMISTDAAGNVYADDISTCNILKITPAGVLSIVAGNGTCITTSPTYGSANTSLPHPEAIGADSAGNVYVSNADNRQVYKITSGGVLSLFAGSGAIGAPNYGTDALTSPLQLSEGLVVTDNGVVYLSHNENNTIDRIGPLTPPAPAGALPVTGSAVVGTAGIGLVLLVLGIGLVRALHRRQYS
jgi:hypothetical protein